VGEAAGIKDQVVEVERDDLRTPECGGKTQEEDGTIPHTSEGPVLNRGKGFAEELNREGTFALWGNAVFTGDSREDIGDERMSGWRCVAVLAVPKGDRGRAPLDRRRLERSVGSAGEARKVGCDGLWGGRERCEPGVFAVVGEVAPIAGVLKAGAGAAGGASIPLCAFDVSVVGYRGSCLCGLNDGGCPWQAS